MKEAVVNLHWLPEITHLLGTIFRFEGVLDIFLDFFPVRWWVKAAYEKFHKINYFLNPLLCSFKEAFLRFTNSSRKCLKIRPLPDPEQTLNEPEVRFWGTSSIWSVLFGTEHISFIWSYLWIENLHTHFSDCRVMFNSCRSNYTFVTSSFGIFIVDQ